MIPYLCGGTFLTQILRVTERTTTPTDRTNGQKEDLPEHELFRRLLSIFRLSDFPADTGGSIKTYASQFKSCRKSLCSFTGFTDSDYRMKFDRDIGSKNSMALYMMSEFVRTFIDVSKNGEQLVRCLLGIIKDDKTIPTNDKFHILLDGGAISKQDITEVKDFYIEPLLLGVWHFIIMSRAETNETGRDTYQSWYPKRDEYRGIVGNDITVPINVKLSKIEDPITVSSTNDTSFEQDSIESAKVVQFIDDATIVNINGEKVVYAKNIEVLNL